MARRTDHLHLAKSLMDTINKLAAVPFQCQPQIFLDTSKKPTFASATPPHLSATGIPEYPHSLAADAGLPGCERAALITALQQNAMLREMIRLVIDFLMQDTSAERSTSCEGKSQDVSTRGGVNPNTVARHAGNVKRCTEQAELADMNGTPESPPLSEIQSEHSEGCDDDDDDMEYDILETILKEFDETPAEMQNTKQEGADSDKAKASQAHCHPSYLQTPPTSSSLLNTAHTCHTAAIATAATTTATAADTSATTSRRHSDYPTARGRQAVTAAALQAMTSLMQKQNISNRQSSNALVATTTPSMLRAHPCSTPSTSTTAIAIATTAGTSNSSSDRQKKQSPSKPRQTSISSATSMEEVRGDSTALPAMPLRGASAASVPSVSPAHAANVCAGNVGVDIITPTTPVSFSCADGLSANLSPPVSGPQFSNTLFDNAMDDCDLFAWSDASPLSLPGQSCDLMNEDFHSPASDTGSSFHIPSSQNSPAQQVAQKSAGEQSPESITVAMPMSATTETLSPPATPSDKSTLRTSHINSKEAAIADIGRSLLMTQQLSQNFNMLPPSPVQFPMHKEENPVQLWEFLLECLYFDCYEHIIRWSNKEEGAFKIVDSQLLSGLWGLYKKRLEMNFDKMSRAMRYYYRKDILEKKYCGKTVQRLEYVFKGKSSFSTFRPPAYATPGRFFRSQALCSPNQLNFPFSLNTLPPQSVGMYGNGLGTTLLPANGFFGNLDLPQINASEASKNHRTRPTKQSKQRWLVDPY